MELPKTDDLKWTMNGEQAYCIQVMFIGKTGYGKSTTLNRICGGMYFDTDDIQSCTKKLYSCEYKLSNNRNDYFSLCDLPGIGESSEADKYYKTWYEQMLEKSACVVYVLRADQRDFALDEMVINSLLRKRDKVMNKLIVGLNYADKMEPLNRTGKYPFKLTNEQRMNLERKAMSVSQSLNVSKEQVLYYSASEGYNFEMLLNAISSVVKANIWMKENPSSLHGISLISPWIFDRLISSKYTD